MPAHHRVGRHERQVLAPACTEPASEDPEQFVPGTKPSTRPRSSRSGQDGELMAQEQVLEYEVVARVNAGQDGREQEPEQFKHAFSIADSCASGLAAPHPRPTLAELVKCKRDGPTNVHPLCTNQSCFRLAAAPTPGEPAGVAALGRGLLQTRWLLRGT